MKKKRNIIIVAMLLLTLVLPVRAQVFIMEEDEVGNRNVLGANGTWNNVIVHGSTDDQANFVPIGNGLLIITALGTCYLMGKRRKDEC